MQLHALNDHHLPVIAEEAEKIKNYFCHECLATVRLRGGNQRQLHFFHLRSRSSCRQAGKSLTHLQLQLYIQNLFEKGAIAIEKPFSQIRRIADVVHEDSKTIFEIQCSSISLAEAKQRCLDYESLGYQVLWILHIKRFNRKKLSAAESYLRNRPCYFTDMNEKGEGLIYDQIELYRKGMRIFRSSPLKIDLKEKKFPTALDQELPEILLERLLSWRFYFSGDLMDRFLCQKISSSYLKLFEKKEMQPSKQPLSFFSLLRSCYFNFFNWMLRTYFNKFFR